MIKRLQLANNYFKKTITTILKKTEEKMNKMDEKKEFQERI